MIGLADSREAESRRADGDEDGGEDEDVRCEV